MCKNPLLMGLACCLSAGTCAARTVRTAAELAAVNRGERTTATNFVLTATLSREGARESTDSLFVYDESGATSLRYPFDRRTAPLRAGDHLRLTGTIGFDDRGSAVIVAQSCTVVGRDAPAEATSVHICDIHAGRIDFRLVRLTATVHDAYVDEIDKSNNFLVLIENGQTLYAAIPASLLSPHELESLVGATVTITGICDAYRVGSRRHQGRTLNPTDKDDIVVDHPASRDRYAAPDIRALNRASPYQLHLFGRHTARGRVIVAWDKSFVLIKTADDEFVGIDTAEGCLPTVGDEIFASGFPETDLYTITLTRAVWKTVGDNLPPTDEALPVRARDLIEKDNEREIMRPNYHGKAIRIEGLVRTLPSVGNESRLFIDCDGTVFPVDINACPTAAESLEIGCRAALTGICIMDIERLRPNTVLPRIRGFTLVMRPSDTVRILARPSWWTPVRIWSVFGALLATLCGVFVWNASLRRLAERRGRQLIRGEIETVKSKLQVEERTRLAVELHDSLSQTLAGVSMEIAAADNLKRGESSEMATHLERAGRTLKSCRDELRNCLWDLRSEALDEPDMTTAVLKTLQPHIDGPQLSVRFNVPRVRVSDNTAHAILRIIRELVVNALQHGRATSVKVAGSLDADGLHFSVRDNGCGFDPNTRPGVLQGHFGLQGICERIEKLGGSLTIDSTPGQGARIMGRIPAHTPTGVGV